VQSESWRRDVAESDPLKSTPFRFSLPPTVFLNDDCTPRPKGSGPRPIRLSGARVHPKNRVEMDPCGLTSSFWALTSDAADFAGRAEPPPSSSEPITTPGLRPCHALLGPRNQEEGSSPLLANISKVVNLFPRVTSKGTIYIRLARDKDSTGQCLRAGPC